MAINAAEEETLEALKKWWDENGKQLVLMVILVFGGYTSWLLWENSRAETADAASDLYEEILTLAVIEPGVPVTDEEAARILELSGQLKTEYGGSIYALYASLFAAQQYVAASDLDLAQASLQWILDNQQDGLFSQTEEGLILTTNLRLGRIMLANGEAERALTLVNNLNPKSFEAGFSELRGDIYIAMGRMIDARDSYIAAQQAGNNSDGLRMKLEELSDES